MNEASGLPAEHRQILLQQHNHDAGLSGVDPQIEGADPTID